MSIGWLVNTFIGAVLLPPLDLLLVAMAGLLLRKRWPRAGMALCIAALLTLLGMSTGGGARLLAATLEQRATPLASARAAGAQAIVVLGGGRVKEAPEYGGRDVPNQYTLSRLRYGARLHRETGLPLLVTGGMPDGSSESEAAIMARSLREDFLVPVKWLEQTSDNTAQNAQLSAKLLQQDGVRKVLLVTDAMHMPRAQLVFAQTGLEVVPAPTTFFSRGGWSIKAFVPNGENLALSHYALHEWIGMAWYRIRHGGPAIR